MSNADLPPTTTPDPDAANSSTLLIGLVAQTLAEMGVVRPSSELLRPLAEALADLVPAGPVCSRD